MEMRELTPALREHLQGRTIKVHRNLKYKLGRLWSITLDGKVVAHTTDISLTNATFPVSRAGRTRVLHEKQKNVHAYVEGKFINERTLAEIPITYDPYTAGHFFEKAGRSAVYTAHAVSLTPAGVFAFGLNDY